MPFVMQHSIEVSPLSYTNKLQHSFCMLFYFCVLITLSLKQIILSCQSTSEKYYLGKANKLAITQEIPQKQLKLFSLSGDYTLFLSRQTTINYYLWYQLSGKTTGQACPLTSKERITFVLYLISLRVYNWHTLGSPVTGLSLYVAIGIPKGDLNRN